MPTETAKPTERSTAEPMTPGEQLERFHEAVGSEAYSAPNAKPGKLGAEKLTPEEQRRRFIEAAREAGAGEDEAAFDAALKRIVQPKAPASSR